MSDAKPFFHCPYIVDMLSSSWMKVRVTLRDGCTKELYLVRFADDLYTTELVQPEGSDTVAAIYQPWSDHGHVVLLPDQQGAAARDWELGWA